ncbi:hypothetical protein IFR05_014406 [Cadophora sp. M221]|nr:hypothetical protein IFR05_014406 [Cadophora sp. M221]
MGFGLPLEIISEIIGHVELRSDLYNWCLVSRATRDFATPRLFRDILVTSSDRVSIKKLTENLRSLLQLSSKRLEHARKFETRCEYETDIFESDISELLKALEASIEKATKLEEWTCFFIPLLTTAPLLFQLDCLTNLSITCPMKTRRYGFLANRAFEEQISQFKNLLSFEIYNIWIPNNASARRIARVLINSPKLTYFGISLDEDRCRAWERGYESITADDEDEIFFNEEEQDLEILDYFPAICQEFNCPTHDPSTGEPILATVFNSTPSTSLLSLRNLGMGSLCALTNHIHLLTNTSVLEQIFIENGADNMFAMSSPYSFSDPALTAIARQAPNLQSVHFGTFDYDCDATGIDLQRDFPALDSFSARDEYDGVVAELSKCGGLGQWRRLALDNPDERIISELDDEFQTLLSGLILKCEDLTHLRVGLKWKDMPLLLSDLVKLSHLKELHLTAFLGEDTHRQSMRDFSVQEIFMHHPGLQITSMVKIDYRIHPYPRLCWRRRWDGLERVSTEELKLLSRDGFPRTMNDLDEVD